VSVWQDKEVIEVQPGYVEESYGAAVDIGSTTVALYLCNLRTGELLAAESEMNPQIVYGEDVMSRIQYAIEHPDGLEKLHKAVIATLNKLLKQAVKSATMSLRAQVATLAPGASAGEQSPREYGDQLDTCASTAFLAVARRSAHYSPEAIRERDELRTILFQNCLSIAVS
jgi:hypothetical protein